MSKPRVFIGSSKESEQIAQTVRKHLKATCDCVVWTDMNFFKANESTYKNLIKKAYTFDFAVFIGGADDFVVRTSNLETKTAPRDNVYLELGLYAGILSVDRTYFLIDKKCKVASDLFGITLFLYDNTGEIKKNCKSIIELISKESKLNRIQLLPSTSLAIGYYENFIEPVTSALFSQNKITVEEECDIKDYPRELKICIPTNLKSDFKTQAEVLFEEKNYQKAELNSHLRKIGLVIDAEALKKEKKVILLDCPQTLRAAFKAVDLAFANDFIGFDKNIQLSKEKEVRNFISTLQNLVITNEHAKKLVNIVRFG